MGRELGAAGYEEGLYGRHLLSMASIMDSISATLSCPTFLSAPAISRLDGEEAILAPFDDAGVSGLQLHQPQE